MKRLTAFFGIAWAVMAVPLVLAGFMGMDRFAGRLVHATGLRVSPWYTGGDSLRCEDRGSWRAVIHEPVLRGLLGERREGFIQIDCKPAAGAALPVSIDDLVDLDGDGTPDVRLQCDTRGDQAALEPLGGASIEARPVAFAGSGRGSRDWRGIGEVIDMGSWKVIRVPIRNPHR